MMFSPPIVKIRAAIAKIQPKHRFLILAGISAVLNLTSWLWIYFKIPAGAFPFILHYNIYFGRDLLGDRWQLFRAPFTGLAVMAVNFAVAWVVLTKDRFLAWMILAATIALEALLVYASGVIVSINS